MEPRTYRKRHFPGVDPLWEGDPVPPTRVLKTNPTPITEPEHPRNKKVVFIGDSWHKPCPYCKQGRHDYFVDGVRYKPSATTFIGQMFHHFDADEMAPKVAGNNYPRDHYYHGLDVAQVKAIWGSASEIGTAMHENIEHYYKGEPYYDDTAEWALFEKFQRMFPDLTPASSEMRAHDDEMRMIGTVDMLFYMEDPETKERSYVMVDWKRVYGLQRWFGGYGACEVTRALPDTKINHYRMQLMLYKIMLERNYDIAIDFMFVACFHPEECADGEPIIVPVDANQELMDKMVAYRKKQLAQMAAEGRVADVDVRKVPADLALEDAYPHDCEGALEAAAAWPWIITGDARVSPGKRAREDDSVQQPAQKRTRKTESGGNVGSEEI